MKVHKPLQLSLQVKPFSWKKKNQLAVTVLLGFPFDSNKEILLEQDLWKNLPNMLGEYQILDNGIPKPQGELLVFGNYYAQGGNPVTADRVNISIGSVNKTLAVIGQRYWRTLLPPTEPEAFVEMPITYNNAFGGTDFKKNTAGKGIEEIDVSGEMRLPLPNIEYPDKLVTSAGQRPDPAGLSPLEMTWEPRHSKMGTYNDKWMSEDFPGYPQDLDWTHFNIAPQDQWIDDFWQGDEAFEVRNMHASKNVLTGKLPAFRTRCFVDQKKADAVVFSEINMSAETVYLFPNYEMGVLLYRGTVEVEEDDATDILHLLVAYEDLKQPQRSKDYYDEALRNRLDDKKTFKFLMYTKDIIADSERCGFARLLDDENVSGDNELAKNLGARVEAEKQKALDMVEQEKQKFISMMQHKNIDPAPYLKQFEVKNNQQIEDPQIKLIMQTLEQILPGSTQGDASAIKPEEIDFSKFDVFSQQMKELMDTSVEQHKDKLREVIENAKGTRTEEMVRQKVETIIEKMDEPADLPRPSGDNIIQQLNDKIKKFEAIQEKMNQQELTLEQRKDLELDFETNLNKLKQDLDKNFSRIKQMYRASAHYIEGKPPHDVPLDIVRYRFIKSMEKGESLAGRDLSGVDFSGLDLSEMDLSDCYLEYTNFSNAKLRGTDMRRTILTHANLTNADFTNAKLEDSNLGASKLNGATFTNVMFTEAVLSKSTLINAKFSQCDIRNQNFLEADLTGVEMQGCNLQGSNFVEIIFNSSKFIECILSDCNFITCELKHCDFSESNLSTSNFIGCSLDYSMFKTANMTNVRFPSECSLQQCNFTGAILDRASFRDVNAMACNFEKATFHSADFSGANLQKTKFYGSQGKRAMFMKSDLSEADFTSVNLMEGSLMKARLTNADLSYSNLFSVEFLGATVGNTDFNGANLDLTRLQDWRPSR